MLLSVKRPYTTKGEGVVEEIKGERGEVQRRRLNVVVPGARILVLIFDISDTDRAAILVTSGTSFKLFTLRLYDQQTYLIASGWICDTC